MIQSKLLSEFELYCWCNVVDLLMRNERYYIFDCTIRKGVKFHRKRLIHFYFDSCQIRIIISAITACKAAFSIVQFCNDNKIGRNYCSNEQSTWIIYPLPAKYFMRNNRLHFQSRDIFPIKVRKNLSDILLKNVQTSTHLTDTSHFHEFCETFNFFYGNGQT